jgi:hypothetical protein
VWWDDEIFFNDLLCVDQETIWKILQIIIIIKSNFLREIELHKFERQHVSIWISLSSE